jgi:hypothetical protein
MIELQDAAGRLIVVLPMRFRYSGKSYAVFLDGKYDAEFCTFGEAMDHARFLAKSGIVEPQPSPA